MLKIDFNQSVHAIKSIRFVLAIHTNHVNCQIWHVTTFNSSSIRDAKWRFEVDCRHSLHKDSWKLSFQLTFDPIMRYTHVTVQI